MNSSSLLLYTVVDPGFPRGRQPHLIAIILKIYEHEKNALRAPSMSVSGSSQCWSVVTLENQSQTHAQVLPKHHNVSHL